jgi:hypothetical protein
LKKGLVVALGGLFFLALTLLLGMAVVEALATGSISYGRGGGAATRAAEPVQYWINVALVALGFAVCARGAFFVAALGWDAWRNTTRKES